MDWSKKDSAGFELPVGTIQNKVSLFPWMERDGRLTRGMHFGLLHHPSSFLKSPTDHTHPNSGWSFYNAREHYSYNRLTLANPPMGCSSTYIHICSSVSEELPLCTTIVKQEITSTYYICKMFTDNAFCSFSTFYILS